MNRPLDFLKNISLKTLSTLGIGGFANYYLEIKTIEEMQMALRFCKSNGWDFLVLGKGSNCLFDDKGFEGAILHNKIDFFETPASGVFHIGAGYSFSLLGSQTARASFGGLEFASGIPASVGGAVFMNAGANGSETSETLVSVDYVDEYGILHTFKKSEIEFSYRTSSFQKLKGAIVGATFALANSPFAREKQLEIIQYRKKSQPYNERSAGCIFRNPENNFAGKLIDQSGLKGFSLGGAKVSEKHANFLINSEEAASQDFLALISHVKKVVEEKTGVKLESEVWHVPCQRIQS